MKIEDYCALKAYALYQKTFLKNNQTNLDAPQNLNFQKQNDFIPQFTRDLRKNVTTFLDRFPEDRDTVRKSLTQILKSNFEHLAENNILDSSGAINPEVISLRLGEGVKKSLPEIYQKAQETEQVKRQTVAQNAENIEKEKVDFGNKEETEKFLDNLYSGLANCQTKSEKVNYIQNKFNISLENMTEAQQDKVISKYETREKILKIKKNLNRTEIRKENPDLTDEEFEELLEDIAAEQYAIENNQDVQIVKSSNRKMIQLDKIFCEIQKLNQQLSNCQDKAIELEINHNLEELENKQKELAYALGLTETEIEKNNSASTKYDENTKVLEAQKYSYDIGNNDNLSDLFDISVMPPEEDLSDLFIVEEPFNMEEILDTNQPTVEEKTAFINPILANVNEDDLNPEDYHFEIEEKQGFWHTLKTAFSKMKHTISEKLGFNKQNYLDTAENNTKLTDNYYETKNNFDQSILVSKEEQERCKKEYENTKNASQKGSTHIHSDNQQSIKF